MSHTPRPFYSKWVWKDWDQATRDLDPYEYTAYHRLISYAASEPDLCSVPADDRRLARAVGFGLKRWLGVRSRVLNFFILRSDGRYQHPRLRKDADAWLQHCENQRLRRTAGPTGGQPPVPPPVPPRARSRENLESDRRKNQKIEDGATTATEACLDENSQMETRSGAPDAPEPDSDRGIGVANGEGARGRVVVPAPSGEVRLDPGLLLPGIEASDRGGRGAPRTGRVPAGSRPASGRSDPAEAGNRNVADSQSPTGRRTRRMGSRASGVDREIPPDFIGRCVARYNLTRETVEYLAERILLEFEPRGYRSARSALLEWCRREAASPRTPNGHTQPDTHDDGLDGARRKLAELEAQGNA